MSTLTCKSCGEEAEIVETKLEDGVDVRAICHECNTITKPDNDGDGPTSTSPQSVANRDPEEPKGRTAEETAPDPEEVGGPEANDEAEPTDDSDKTDA